MKSYYPGKPSLLEGGDSVRLRPGGTGVVRVLQMGTVRGREASEVWVIASGSYCKLQSIMPFALEV